MSNTNTVRGATYNTVSIAECYNQLVAAATDVLGDKLIDVTMHDLSDEGMARLELRGPTAWLKPTLRTFEQDYPMLTVAIATKLDGTSSVIVREAE